MKCIFCKSNSDGSSSVEHIVPESLGNKEHVLPRGWVCDSCNNYLAIKVEKPFLDSLYACNARAAMRVPNKRGSVPAAKGWHSQSKTRVEILYGDRDGMSIAAAPGEDEKRWTTALQTQRRGTVYVPTPDFPQPTIATTRFIAKVALEVLAFRCLHIEGWNDELVNKLELDEIRRYVRLGAGKLLWAVSMRRIYQQDFVFSDGSAAPYEVLHEFDILFTAKEECFVVIAIFGIEYAINLGGPTLDGYYEWLQKNGNRSPLH